mmetsp:Transcript_1332/g.3475  ORF Transcript_1332/g.3475 Transcript_1332/m.3475 type:complete len:243 (-) Transcript_1332:178-906(-)
MLEWARAQRRGCSHPKSTTGSGVCIVHCGGHGSTATGPHVHRRVVLSFGRWQRREEFGKNGVVVGLRHGGGEAVVPAEEADELRRRPVVAQPRRPHLEDLQHRLEELTAHALTLQPRQHKEVEHALRPDLAQAAAGGRHQEERLVAHLEKANRNVGERGLRWTRAKQCAHVLLVRAVIRRRRGWLWQRGRCGAVAFEPNEDELAGVPQLSDRGDRRDLAPSACIAQVLCNRALVPKRVDDGA